MPLRRHLSIVAGLLGVSCLVQWVVISRTIVPALDSARYALAAETIDAAGLLPAIRGYREHPLFPVWVWAVHRGLATALGDVPALWALSVQLAAAIPLVLCVVPVYWIALRLFGPGAALAGTAFFCVLPEIARLGADGITDTAYLLPFSVALAAVVMYWTGPHGRGSMAEWQRGLLSDGSASPPPRRPLWLLLAGLATGVAGLARAEGLVLPAALAVTLIVFQFMPSRRQAWSRVAVAAGCFGLGLAAVFGPYLWVVGAPTPKAALARLLGRGDGTVERPLGEGRGHDDGPAAGQSGATPCVTTPADVARWRLADGQPMSFALKDPGSIRKRGWGAALTLFGYEFIRVFWYWIGILGAYALWRVRHSRGNPVDWFVRIFLLTYCLAIIGFVAQEGYLVARHLAPLVVAAIGCAGYGAIEAGWAWCAWRARRGSVPSDATRARQRTLAAAAVTLLAAGACLAQTFRPCGPTGLAHRAAAAWLATTADAAGSVVDTHGWTGLYSGRKTHPYGHGRVGFSDPQLAYVVVETQELQSDSARCRTLRRLLETAGQQVAEFSGPASTRVSRDVAVYRWYPERFGKKGTGTVCAEHPKGRCAANCTCPLFHELASRAEGRNR
jgi:hypothetical protein